jgi:hypothetical protein
MRTTSMMLATSLWLLAIGAGAAQAGDACSATTKATQQDCKLEAAAKAALANGACANLSTKEAVKACKAEVKTTLGEDKSDCADQLDAHKAACDKLGKDPYDPIIAQADFLSPTATAASPNQYFPLVPGTVWTYAGGGEVDVVTVTDRTRVIDGVTTIIVHDVGSVNGVVQEDTEDYFAQNVDGSVWYFGELSQTLEDGVLVGLGGSFRAGVDGAKPGIIMEASPKVGDVYRQEFALGVAEDTGEVTSITGTESVPGGSCNGTCVVTLDGSAREPGPGESKYYAPGIGSILEIDLETGTRLELQSVTHN